MGCWCISVASQSWLSAFWLWMKVVHVYKHRFEKPKWHVSSKTEWLSVFLNVVLRIDLLRLCFYLGRGHEHNSCQSTCPGVHLSMFIDRKQYGAKMCPYPCQWVSIHQSSFPTRHWKLYRQMQGKRGYSQQWKGFCCAEQLLIAPLCLTSGSVLP